MQLRLKMKRSHVNQCGKLHANALHFAEILRSCLEYSNYSPDTLLYSAHSVTSNADNGPSFGPVSRLNLGIACRESGEQYRSALLIAMSSVALHRMLTATSTVSPSAPPLSLEQVVESLLHSRTTTGTLPLLEKELLLVQAAGGFVMRAIDAMQLEGVWNMPLLLDGTKIQAVSYYRHCFTQGIQSMLAHSILMLYYSFLQIFKNIPMDGAFKLVSFSCCHIFLIFSLNMSNTMYASQLMSEQLAWQLKHPHGSTMQLESYLKELYSTFL